MRRLLFLGYRGVAMALSFFPQRRRFRAAVELASTFPRQARHRLSPRLKRRPGISSLREMVLGILLDAMDQHHVRYDPDLEVHGLDALAAKLREGRGVLLVGTHANGVLSRLALRAMHDAHVPITLVAISESFPYGGTGTDIPAIVPGPTFMIPLRTKLRRGEMVGAMVDSWEPTQHSIELRAGGGSVWISDALLRLAVACNAAIAFIAARLEEDGRIVLTFSIAPGAADAERSRNEFVKYAGEQIAGAALPVEFAPQ